MGSNSDIDANTSPKSLPETISRTELLEELSGPNPPVLVEALGAAYFADAHLPGAINIPPGLVDRIAPQLVRNPHTRIVVYCSGVCESSRIVARRLLALGYSDVAVYDGGKEDWVEHGLPLERSYKGS
jgi:rhodanese-related sulfurtransferase